MMMMQKNLRTTIVLFSGSYISSYIFLADNFSGYWVFQFLSLMGFPGGI